MKTVSMFVTAVTIMVTVAGIIACGDVNDTWDWKNDPATGKPKRKLVIGYDPGISNFLAATGYSLEEIAQEAADNWNQHKTVSGWEFVFTNNPAGADVVIMSGDSPVPNGGASTSRGTNASGAVVQARVIFDPTPQAKKRDAAGRPEFDPDTGEQVVEDLTWGTNGVAILDLITVTKHEFSHLLRKKHNKDANGKEKHDTGNLCDPASAGNHQREPSGADVTNITISATQAVKRATGTVAPGTESNIQVPKTQTPGAGLLVPPNAATNGMGLTVTPLEGFALPDPDGLSPALGLMALGVEITSSPPGSRFANPATATLSYDDALWQNLHVGAVDESTLQPFRFDPTTQAWMPIPLLNRDPAANTISFPVSNLNSAVYGIAGKELAVTNRHNLVVYVSDGGSRWENFDIYAMDTDSRMTTRLTMDPGIDNHPEISPDGKWLVWSSTRGGGDFDLYLADLANVEGTWRRLTVDDHPNGPQTSYPDRHPHFHTIDPRIIVFTSKNLPLASPVTIASECSQPKIIVPPRYYETLNVLRLTPEGAVDTYVELDIRNAWDSAGKPDIWTNNTCTYAGHPSFSHSGSQLVFSASIDGGGKVWEVYTVGFDTNGLALVPNSLRRITSGPVIGSNPIQMSGGAHFSEDDSEIYFSSTRTPDGNSQIFSVPAGSENVPVTAATPRTTGAGNYYVPEPLMDGGFVVVSDLGEPGMCGQTNGPTRDLDILLIGPGSTENLTDNDASDEMLLIGDEVSWFCGTSPNLSACRSYPRVYTIESLWLERGAWQYLKGLAPWTLIPEDLLAKHGYPDQAVRMYATGWKNMEAVMAGEHAGWTDITNHIGFLNMMAQQSFPGLTNELVLFERWMQNTTFLRNMKVVSESIMHDRGIGAPWQPWVSTWTNPAGGDFDDRANWDLDHPGSNDTARFDGRHFDIVTTGRVIRVDLSGDRSIATVPIEMVQLDLVSVLTNPPTVTVSNNITISLSTNFSGLTISNVNLTVTNRSSKGEIKIGTNGHLRARGAKVRADRLGMEPGSTLDLDLPATSFFDVFLPVDLPPVPWPPYITVGSGGVFRAASGIRLGGAGATGSAVRVTGGTLIATNFAGTGTVAVAGGLLEITGGGTATVDRVSLSTTNSAAGVWNVDSFFDITYRIGFSGVSNRLTVGTGAVARCPFALVGNAPTHAGNGIDLWGGTLIVTNAFTNGCLYLTPGDLAVHGGTATVNRVIVRGAASGISLPEGRLEVRDMTHSNGLPLVVGDGTNGLAELITGFGGVLRLDGGLEVCRDADLSGDGVISLADTTVFVHQFGEIRPGKSPGVLTIDGSLAMADTATLRIELAGAAVGAGYDRLAVAGHADLNGKLSVTLINGFAPSAGASFDVLTYGSYSNAFTTVNLPPLGADDLWHVSYGSTSVTLRVLARTGDFDADGIPNGWEYDYFGSATGADPNARATNGVNTLLEAYVADLNPTNPASVFPPLTGIGDPVWVLVVDPSSTARVYDVEWGTNLLQVPLPWTPYGFDRFGTGSNLNFTITNQGPVRFYRTTVRAP